MKKLSVSLATSLCLLVLPFFGGCSSEPKIAGDWQLDYYEKYNERYDIQFDEMDYFKPVARDRVKLELKNDNTFTFTDYRGTMYEGTYEYQRARKWYGRGELYLYTQSGYCFASGDIQSSVKGESLSLSDFTASVHYYFVSNLERTWGSVIEEGLAREGERLKVFDESGAISDGVLHCGIVEQTDDEFFLTLFNDYGEIMHYNLSKSRELYVYECDESYVIMRGELHAGACIVKMPDRYERNFAIHYVVE